MGSDTRAMGRFCGCCMDRLSIVWVDWSLVGSLGWHIPKQSYNPLLLLQALAFMLGKVREFLLLNGDYFFLSCFPPPFCCLCLFLYFFVSLFLLCCFLSFVLYLFLYILLSLCLYFFISFFRYFFCFLKGWIPALKGIIRNAHRDFRSILFNGAGPQLVTHAQCFRLSGRNSKRKDLADKMIGGLRVEFKAPNKGKTGYGAYFRQCPTLITSLKNPKNDRTE